MQTYLEVSGLEYASAVAINADYMSPSGQFETSRQSPLAFLVEGVACFCMDALLYDKD